MNPLTRFVQQSLLTPDEAYESKTELMKLAA